MVVTDRADPHWLYNWALALHRIDASRSEEVAEKLRQFYGSNADGYSAWDPWCSLDLRPHNFDPEAMPFMVRHPDGLAPPPPPPGLSIRRCVTVWDLHNFGRIVGACFDPPSGTETVAPQRFAAAGLGNGPVRLWLGDVDGKPVTCSCVFVAQDALYVDFVATLLEHRGQG